jgi:hypothetical protein
MGHAISKSFDTGVDLETQNGLFISGVGVYSEEYINSIVGYYVSPYGKKTSEYIYKPVTGNTSMNGSAMQPMEPPPPTTSVKFSPGYFLANIKRSHTLDRDTGIEKETIIFITKNYEKKVEEVILDVNTMLMPVENYMASTHAPTQCLDGQYIKTLGQKYKTMSDVPRTFSHTCQDSPVSSTSYKAPIIGAGALLLIVLILYMVFAGVATGAMQQNRQTTGTMQQNRQTTGTTQQNRQMDTSQDTGTIGKQLSS